MNPLAHPKERLYYLISVAASALLYIILIISLVGIYYCILGICVACLLQGLAIGRLQGNAVRLSEKQFPEVYHMAQKLGAQMQLKEIPAIYIQHGNGILHSFTTRFLGSDYVVISSEIFELAYEQGSDVLGFILAHEFAHIKSGHNQRSWMILPSRFVPFLSHAYSRVCEYSCDRIAAHFMPAGAKAGLTILVAGKKLYRHIQVDDYLSQYYQEADFWTSLSEALSSHPHLPKRIAAVQIIAPQIRGDNNPLLTAREPVSPAKPPVLPAPAKTIKPSRPIQLL